MAMKKRQTKLETLVRYAMVYHLSGVLPLYVINEFPKSGGSWVGQMLSRALGLSFPRNQFPQLKSCILHGHYLHPGINNVLIVWRDGRDDIISWYHHCLFLNESGRNKPVVDRLRQKFQFTDYTDLHANLPEFIEHCFTEKYPMKFSWKDFVNKWINEKTAVFVRYEDLRTAGAEELCRVVKELTGEPLSPVRANAIIDEFSFAKQAGRAPGMENKNSFLRKGIVGDWKNHFSLEARQLFDQFVGNELIQLGYEQNHDWVDDGALPAATKIVLVKNDSKSNAPIAS